VKQRFPVVLATGNAGKGREFDRLFAGAVEGQPMPPGVQLPDETGLTFADNARLKAQTVFEALGCAQTVVADDSGLEVTALGGRPGIYSARFAGEGATDAQNVAKLLAELEGAADRSAHFVCALCLILPSDAASSGKRSARETVEVECTTKGAITAAPRGLDGFGYDPVFLPEGWRLTLAEASPADKDSVSHRGAAARALVERLRTLETA
jgi:non-canonical purine NTP pyrophosphatase (RdgB/HAM1 family)